jgi:Domain of unknown function (DUF4399)
MHPSRLALALLVVVTGAAAPLSAQATAAPTIQAPTIQILLPANGARVSSPVTVRFNVTNYGVAPAGMAMERTGHFHLLIDAEAGAPGTIIPADSQHIHYGKGQIEVSVPIPAGRHVLRAVLGDHLHKVISPELVSAPVTITVRARR